MEMPGRQDVFEGALAQPVGHGEREADRPLHVLP